MLDAPEVPPGGGVWRLAAAWPGQTVVLPASTCLELPIRPLPELLAELPSRHRRDLARQQRRADRLALRAERVPPAPEPIAAAVADLLDLHARQWAGRPVNPLHLDPRFRAHLTDAARAMVPAGQAALTRFVLAGELVGVAFALIADGAIGGYLYGVRPELRDRLDVSALVVRSTWSSARPSVPAGCRCCAARRTRSCAGSRPPGAASGCCCCRRPVPAGTGWRWRRCCAGPRRSGSGRPTAQPYV